MPHETRYLSPWEAEEQLHRAAEIKRENDPALRRNGQNMIASNRIPVNCPTLVSGANWGGAGVQTTGGVGVELGSRPSLGLSERQVSGESVCLPTRFVQSSNPVLHQSIVGQSNTMGNVGQNIRIMGQNVDGYVKQESYNGRSGLMKSPLTTQSRSESLNKKTDRIDRMSSNSKIVRSITEGVIDHFGWLNINSGIMNGNSFDNNGRVNANGIRSITPRDSENHQSNKIDPSLITPRRLTQRSPTNDDRDNGDFRNGQNSSSPNRPSHTSFNSSNDGPTVGRLLEAGVKMVDRGSGVRDSTLEPSAASREAFERYAKAISTQKGQTNWGRETDIITSREFDGQSIWKSSGESKEMRDLPKDVTERLYSGTFGHQEKVCKLGSDELGHENLGHDDAEVLNTLPIFQTTAGHARSLGYRSSPISEYSQASAPVFPKRPVVSELDLMKLPSLHSSCSSQIQTPHIQNTPRVCSPVVSCSINQLVNQSSTVNHEDSSAHRISLETRSGMSTQRSRLMIRLPTAQESQSPSECLRL